MGGRSKKLYKCLIKDNTPLVQRSRMALLLIGSTGNGKSTLGNFLIDPDDDHIFGDNGVEQTFPTSRSNVPETKSVSTATFRHEGQTFTVVDTPGLNEDDWKEDFSHMIDIVKKLRTVESVRACVFCVKFESRIDAQYKATIEYYSKLLPALFEGNVVIVMTDFSTDDRSVKMRQKRHIDEEEMKENAKDAIKRFAKLSFDPQLFTIDCQPKDENEQETSLVTRKAILDYSATLSIVSAEVLCVAKTDYIKQMDERECIVIEGKISGYKERLHEVNKPSQMLIEIINDKQLEKLNLEKELIRLKEDLNIKDCGELIIAEHRDVSRGWKFFKWLREDVDIVSEWKIDDVDTWTNGRCEWREVDRKPKRYIAQVKGKFMRGVHASVTLKTAKRNKYYLEVATLRGKITAKEALVRTIEDFLAVLQTTHTGFEGVLKDLERHIDECSKQLISLSSNYMTLEEAHSRLSAYQMMSLASKLSTLTAQ